MRRTAAGYIHRLKPRESAGNAQRMPETSMPDEGASMRDARPDPAGAGRPPTLPQDHNRRGRVQDKRMPEYELEQRLEESAGVIERAGGEGGDDGSDQVVEEPPAGEGRQHPPAAP